jgi:excisionase family DNA binding protein
VARLALLRALRTPAGLLLEVWEGRPLSNLAAGRLLTAEDLAERWQVTRAQVYRLAREGRVPMPIGRYYRFRLAAIEAWEHEQEARADG